MNVEDLGAVRDSSDQLVQSVQYYNAKSLLFHGYLTPFLIIHLISTFWYLFTDNDQTDLYIIASIILVLIQCLTFLSILWSVHCLCFLSYTKVLIEFSNLVFQLILFLFFILG